MLEQNNSKKILLSVLGVAILIVAVVGISFAALSFDEKGDTNSITTGTITMSFSEATNGILLKDALPMDDTVGKGLVEHFDFTVLTKANSTVDIAYVISVTPLAITASDTVVGGLKDSEVKVYLEKKVGDKYVEAVAPILVDDLTSYADVRTGSFILDEVTDSHVTTNAANTAVDQLVETTVTTEYRLRMWVDENVDVDYLSATEGKHYEYKLLVNVDGSAKALGATTVTP